jgi:serine phosphatase RsbU (regulator of sigma subunit)
MKLLITPAEREPFELELKDGSFVVGRSSTAEVVLADLYASRHHARLTVRGDSLQVQDLGSRNGTSVNGRPAVQPIEVNPGDLIRIAGSTLRRAAEGELISDVMARGTGSAAAVVSTVIRPGADILGDSSDSLDAITAGEALRNYARRLKTLRGIHRSFSRAASQPVLLQAVLDWAFELFSPKHGDIYLRDSDGELRRVASRPSVIHALGLPEETVAQVMQQGMAVATSVETMRQVGATASLSPSFLLAAPMRDGEASFGMLVLSSERPWPGAAQQQLDLLVELAGEAALELRKIALIEEAEQRRLLELELSLARRIQLTILTGDLPSFQGYSFESRNLPSRGVSGDFYGLTLRAAGDECVLFMGDVSGKGFSAALLTASVEALAAAMIEAGDGPAEMCTKLSRQLFHRTLPSGFVTAFVAALDRQTGRVVYTNAGHNAPLLARPDGSLEELRSIGLPLAVMRDRTYGAREVLLEPGATLLLYTDGITEAVNRDDEEYGLERLRACFMRHHRASPTEILNAVQADLDEFVGEVPYHDDRTVLMVRRLQSRGLAEISD